MSKEKIKEKIEMLKSNSGLDSEFIQILNTANERGDLASVIGSKVISEIEKRYAENKKD